MIIFDLGGVLLQEAETNLLPALPQNIDIELINGKPRRIFNRMFEFINLICGKDCKRDWIMGIISGKEIVHKIQNSIDDPKFQSFFKNQQEKNLIKYGAESILDPEKLTQLTLLNLEGLEFVKKCKRSGTRILILSNWDPESFDLIKKKFSQLFNLCHPNDIVIPAMVGFIKPEDGIYKYVINSLHVDLNNTFFVDDSLTNVAAAQKNGINSILHAHWQQTESELIKQGLGFNDKCII